MKEIPLFVQFSFEMSFQSFHIDEIAGTMNAVLLSQTGLVEIKLCKGLIFVGH
jgi:hypothetical protein